MFISPVLISITVGCIYLLLLVVMLFSLLCIRPNMQQRYFPLPFQDVSQPRSIFTYCLGRELIKGVNYSTASGLCGHPYCQVPLPDLPGYERIPHWPTSFFKFPVTFSFISKNLLTSWILIFPSSFQIPPVLLHRDMQLSMDVLILPDSEGHFSTTKIVYWGGFLNSCSPLPKSQLFF